MKIEEKDSESQLDEPRRVVEGHVERAVEEPRIADSFFKRYIANVLEKIREANNLRKYKKDRRGSKLKDIFKDLFSVFFIFVQLLVYILGPVFSALSIWLSVLGIAFTIFSGIEPFINLANWIRFLTITWRNFTHEVWDVIAPYIGFSIPIDLKDFATFISILFIAFLLGLSSRGTRLVVYEAMIGIRMAVFGISHAINMNLSDGSALRETTRLTLLFHEIDSFLSKNISKFVFYSIPFLIASNVAFRVGIIFIPMIILVPESAFEDYFGVTATRVEYLFLSACISYFAEIAVLVGGFVHMILHCIRAVIIFFISIIGEGSRAFINPGRCVLNSLKAAEFGLSYRNDNEVRNIWSENYFLARVSAAFILSNWAWFPVSSSLPLHRKFDFFLWLSERRFADPAYIDRMAKGLLLFFVLYSFNWVSINGDNILNMFQPPRLE